MRQVVCGILAAAAGSTLVVAATSVRAEPGEERSFAVAGFDAVKSVASDTIEIVPGQRTSVVAHGDPRALASLAVDVQDRILRIGRTPGTHSDHGATIRVTLPTLRAVTLAGSSDIRAEAVDGSEFTANLYGSGKLEFPSVRVRRLALKLDGSGRIIAAGRSDETTISMGGTGEIDTRRLVTPDLAITLGGSGTIVASASRVAHVDASGAGNVQVTGHPRCDIHKSGTTQIACN